MDSLIVTDRYVTSVASPKGPCPSPVKKVCHFSCKICFNLAEEPVVNIICGHLFCWSCLYESCTISKRQQEGRPEGCPFCGCHLDISAAGLTVCPLYSSHEPGQWHSFDTDDEEALNEEAYKGGQGRVPPRRSWFHNRIHASQANCIVQMFVCFKLTRQMFKGYLPYLFPSGPPTQYGISCIQTRIAELIGNLQGGRRWLTGKEYVRQPITGKSGVKETEVFLEDEEAIIRWRRKEQQNLQFDLSPTTDDFSIHLSSFLCGICKATAFEPVVTVCGHLFCWMCLCNEIGGNSRCPVCSYNVNVYRSRSNINPIYCEPNGPLKEDEFLKSTRRNGNDKLAPCRIPPTIAAPFLDYMIEKVMKMEDAMMTELTDLQVNHTRKDYIENVALRIEGHWDELFRDILIRWRMDSGEKTPEKLIIPSFLDFSMEQIKKYEAEGKIAYDYTDLLVDIFGDTGIDY